MYWCVQKKKKLKLSQNIVKGTITGSVDDLPQECITEKPKESVVIEIPKSRLVIGDTVLEERIPEEKEKVIEPLEIEDQDSMINPSEEELFKENQIKNDLFLNDEIIDDLSTDNLMRKIEIVIEGESWVVVFDKNERLLYELMQTGSYELSGMSPLRFKIGYAPATNLYIDGKKISFSRAIKGASNYAHFWVNEANKVESIRD